MSLDARAASDLFRHPPGTWVDVPGGQVGVRTVGAGPDVLMVHGWPVSGATFRRLLPDLACSHRCHVLDLIGAGDSRFDATASFSIEAHAGAVRRVVEALDLDDVVLVAHDSGGLIARHALAGDPRVRAWGLIDTEQPGRASLPFRAFAAAGRLPGFGQVLAAALRRPRVRRLGPVLGASFHDRRHIDGEFAEFFLDPLAEDPARSQALPRFVQEFEMSTIADLSHLHERIDVPVAIVNGRGNPFFPAAGAAAMASTFAGPTTTTIIDDAGLFSQEEQPRAVVAALDPILDRR